MGTPKQVFLYLSHRLSKQIIREYASICKAAEGIGDTCFLYHSNSPKVPSQLESLNHYLFSDDGLSELHYPMSGNKLIPGYCHYPLLRYFRDNSGYDFYWIIEYDVRFSGDWRLFFDEFASMDTDFVACHIRDYAAEPLWQFWSLQHPKKSIPVSERLRSFSPVCRISKASLDFIHLSLLDGWCGHQEVVLPTLLYNNGFTLMEFGGRGRFTPPHMEERFYASARPNAAGILSNGTMRWRPAFWRVAKGGDRLYHPVKPFFSFLRDNIMFYGSMLLDFIRNRMAGRVGKC